MKRILLIAILMVLPIIVNAQNPKKVAVWETQTEDIGISNLKKNLVRDFMEEAINNTPGYRRLDRARFDVIVKEIRFQQSGAVKDIEIIRAGEMAGANYVVVPSVNADGNDFLVTVRMIDIATSDAKTVTDLCSNSAQGIKEACERLAVRMFGNITGGGSYSPPQSGGNGNAGTQQGADKITIRVGNVSFDMVKVQAGSFVMGCTSEQGGECYGDESPYHRVTITQDYYFGVYEVTQELYQAVMGVNPSSWKAYDRPVENVSWNDAQEFCSELSRMTGRRFSLPTEAEWEYAARGGNKSSGYKYSGSSRLAAVAWYTDNSGGQTNPVGRLQPNELGIYDMSGNVWEWCQDRYGNYSSSSMTDPRGPSTGSYRVLRGGSWGSLAKSCRVSIRYYGPPDYRNSYYGFRVVLH